MDKRVSAPEPDNVIRPLRARQGLPTVCIIGAGVGAFLAMSGGTTKTETVAQTEPPTADPPTADPPAAVPAKADPPQADPPQADPPPTDPPPTDPPANDPAPPQVDPPTQTPTDVTTSKDPVTDPNATPATKPRLGKVTVHFSGAPRAQILVDGKPYGRETSGRVSLELSPGQHTIRVQAKGYKPDDTKVRVEAGGSRDVRLTLEKKKQSVNAVEDPFAD